MTPELKGKIFDAVTIATSKDAIDDRVIKCVRTIEILVDDSVSSALMESMEFGPLLDAVGLVISSKYEKIST